MKAIYQWVLRTMMKDQTGVMQTLPKRDLIEFNVQMTAERLARNGIDPNALKNANQVENAINQIEAPRNVQQGIRNTESAKVFDMTGKKIDPRSKIMGGKQAETEAEILARINEENKKAVKSLKERKKPDVYTLDDYDTTNMSDIKKEIIRTETKLGNLNPTTTGFREKAKPLIDKIEELKKKLNDPEDFADGGVAGLLGERTGFFMGGPSSKGLGLLKQILNYMSKKGIKEDRFKGQNLSGLDMLRFSNPKAYNKMLDDPNKLFMRGREGIMATDMVKDYQKSLGAQRRGLTEKSLDVAKAMKKDQDRIAKRIAEEAKTTIIPQVKKQLMEGMGMSDEAAQKAAEDMAAAAQNIRRIDDPPKITDEGILQLENVLKNMETGGKKKRELNATGGRIGFDEGGMTRRTFLKILGGLAAIPIVGKFLKPMKVGKTITKVPVIQTDNVPGKPEWFDALVNRVIIEGDDVTKRFATGERQSIHQKTLDDGSVVRVTEDIDDGAVRVEYESDESMFGEPVQLQYKKPLPDEGDPRPAAEFEVSESGFVSRPDGPDDYVFEGEDMVGSSIRDLESDVSKLKQYATGQKQTLKEFVQSKKRKDKVAKLNEGDPAETSDYISQRQPEPDIDYGVDDYASGGRIGFSKGKLANLARRNFMKLLGGVGAGIGAFKTGILGFGKGASKQVAKDLTQVPIQNAEGMPSWFKPLVNRVIKEGVETTKLPPNKGGAYLDRQIVHSAKLGEGQGVKVYQNLDDQTIRVEYQSVDNMGGIDDAVHLDYKAAKEIVTKKGSVKTKPTFEAEEAYPHNTTGDYKDITFEGSNVVNKVDDLYSDTSALKQFGTNKALTKKELEIAKQKQKRVNEINNDLGEQNQLLPDPPDYDDFASGGLARC